MYNCTKAAFKSLTEPVLLKTTHLILRHDQIINNCNNIPTVIAVAFIFVIHVSILGQLVNLLYAVFLQPVLYILAVRKLFSKLMLSSVVFSSISFVE